MVGMVADGVVRMPARFALGFDGGDHCAGFVGGLLVFHGEAPEHSSGGFQVLGQKSGFEVVMMHHVELRYITRIVPDHGRMDEWTSGRVEAL
jgi:hypothetical protein